MSSSEVGGDEDDVGDKVDDIPSLARRFFLLIAFPAAVVVDDDDDAVIVVVAVAAIVGIVGIATATGIAGGSIFLLGRPSGPISTVRERGRKRSWCGGWR